MSKNITSPPGLARFPAIVNPNTRFNEAGDYSADIVLNPGDEGVQEFLDTLESMAQAKYDEVAEGLPKKKAEALRLHVPFDDEVDRESGEPTGNIVVKCRIAASGKKKDGTPWERKLTVFNPDGSRYEGGEIWGGSIIQFSAEPNLWHMPATEKAGLSLKLRAVRVLEARTGGARSAEDFGFDMSAPVTAGSEVIDDGDVPF